MKNPYLPKGKINTFLAKVPPKAAEALRALDARLDQRINPARPYWVYVLAFARQAPLYIDLTDDPGGIVSVAKEFMLQQAKVVGIERIKAIRMVWFDTFETQEQAQARCAELKATPQRWQRQIVAQLNPDWVALEDYMTGFPFLSCVGEQSTLAFMEVMHGPQYREV